jgi:hypothetical protein
MTHIALTNELRGDLGELYFKHLCQQRGYGYVRLEDIYNNFGLDGILEFKCGFEVGHTPYLDMYDRKDEEEKLELFLAVEPSLRINFNG